jgi:hypothetical protein
MNRDQCRSILANLELIQHFAAGGDVAYYIVGKPYLSNKITLNCLHNSGSNYVRLKTRIAVNPETGKEYPVARQKQIGLVEIADHEIMPRNARS